MIDDHDYDGWVAWEGMCFENLSFHRYHFLRFPPRPVFCSIIPPTISVVGRLSIQTLGRITRRDLEAS